MPHEKRAAGSTGAITYSDDPARVDIAQLLELYHVTYGAISSSVARGSNGAWAM